MVMYYYYLSQLNRGNQHAINAGRSSFNGGSYSSHGEPRMCEFNVIVKGKTQFRDVVYAKAENGNVTVKNVLGEAKEFKKCRIVEVDVNATRLVLASV